MLMPDALRGLDDETELCPLVGFRQRIAGDRRCETALRTDREAVQVDIVGGFVGAAA